MGALREACTIAWPWNTYLPEHTETSKLCEALERCPAGSSWMQAGWEHIIAPTGRLALRKVGWSPCLDEEGQQDLWVVLQHAAA